ncbi:hypothetical protein [Aquabacterium sp. J223]|uniref:hypothetical protein n=1 Tax=Aquabacterium sp. J223 TaxID=2898431 RepID=UPI0021ADA210|nr:hypothetical protein [Aquabacterium sp. J223]UUX96089.1 hypothetical protein LRS07_01765 [Aquabacterium sp. J223]
MSQFPSSRALPQDAEAFRSTLPLGEADLVRLSDFQRYLREVATDDDPDTGGTRLTSLSPSLLADLQRFTQPGRQTELLEVVAACMRHARPLSIHLGQDERVLRLSLFPLERVAHCTLPMAEFLQSRLLELQVLHVEPAVIPAPGQRFGALVAEADQFHPLAPLTWHLALHGSREELLPEIAGLAAYRVAPGVDLAPLALGGVLRTAVERLQRQSTNLRALAEWPGFDRGRATRLLNALYLQAGLIVSRSHPAAAGEPS